MTIIGEKLCVKTISSKYFQCINSCSTICNLKFSNTVFLTLCIYCIIFKKKSISKSRALGNVG